MNHSSFNIIQQVNNTSKSYNQKSNMLNNTNTKSNNYTSLNNSKLLLKHNIVKNDPLSKISSNKQKSNRIIPEENQKKYFNGRYSKSSSLYYFRYLHHLFSDIINLGLTEFNKLELTELLTHLVHVKFSKNKKPQ